MPSRFETKEAKRDNDGALQIPKKETQRVIVFEGEGFVHYVRVRVNKRDAFINLNVDGANISGTPEELQNVYVLTRPQKTGWYVGAFIPSKNDFTIVMTPAGSIHYRKDLYLQIHNKDDGEPLRVLNAVVIVDKVSGK